jgi:hypothetical protein
MVGMGLITVFEADLLFPAQLDVLILSPLPIAARRLVLARVLATLLFLVLFLLGINSLGLFAYPPITELHVRRLFLANITSVLVAGAFSCASFVALQGLLICTLRDRSYRRASAWLQCVAVTLLLVFFLSLPKTFPILSAASAHLSLARWIPPLWFLGLYECILAGPARLPQFAPLAHLACLATAAAVVLAIAFYPFAYRRRTRQAIEGPGPESPNRITWNPFHWALHALIFRTAHQRAVYHFLNQSLRMPTLRIYLAMYAGAGIALVAISSIQFRPTSTGIRLGLETHALHTVLPATAFLAVIGLSCAFASSSDPRSGWIFRIAGGEPAPAQLNSVRSWVAIFSTLLVTGAATALAVTARSGAEDLRQLIVSWVVATGLCWILSDLVLFRLTDIPFVQPRITHNTDVAWIVGRALVLLPVTLSFAQLYGRLIGEHAVRQAVGISLMIAVHLTLRHFAANSTHTSVAETIASTDILTGLGLEL